MRLKSPYPVYIKDLSERCITYVILLNPLAYYIFSIFKMIFKQKRLGQKDFDFRNSLL